MKFKMDMNDVLYALTVVKDTVGGDTGGHAGIRIYASKKNRIKFSSLDGNHGTEIWMDGSVNEAGIAVVKADRFISYMMKLNVKDVTLSLNKKGSVTVKSIRGESTFYAYDVAGFPEMYKVEEDSSFDLAGKLFRSMITGVAFATKKEKESNDKPVLQGINVRSTGKMLELSTTNGHAIAFFKKKLQTKEMNVTLSKKTLLNAARMVKDDDKVTIKCGNNSTFSVKIRDATYYIPVFDGAYPELRKVIPGKDEDFDAEFTTERSAMLELLDRGCAALTTKAGRGIIQFEKGKVTIKGDNGEVEFNENLDATLTGDAQEVKVNFVQLTDILKNIDADVLRIGVRNKMPVMIRPEGRIDHTCLLAIG